MCSYAPLVLFPIATLPKMRASRGCSDSEALLIMRGALIAMALGPRFWTSPRLKRNAEGVEGRGRGRGLACVRERPLDRPHIVQQPDPPSPHPSSCARGSLFCTGSRGSQCRWCHVASGRPSCPR